MCIYRALINACCALRIGLISLSVNRHSEFYVGTGSTGQGRLDFHGRAAPELTQAFQPRG